MAVTCVVLIAFVVQSTSSSVEDEAANLNEPPLELVLLDVASPPARPANRRAAVATGRAYSQTNHFREQVEEEGEIATLCRRSSVSCRQPSMIPAAIPTTPPLNPPALPVAGIDIDPSLWKDIEARVYGDPRFQISNSIEWSRRRWRESEQKRDWDRSEVVAQVLDQVKRNT